MLILFLVASPSARPETAGMQPLLCFRIRRRIIPPVESLIATQSLYYLIADKQEGEEGDQVPL